MSNLPDASETDTYGLRKVRNTQITDFHIENTTENRVRTRLKKKSKLDLELSKIQEKINNLNL
jgi:hypothetical protein